MIHVLTVAFCRWTMSLADLFAMQAGVVQFVLGRPDIIHIAPNQAKTQTTLTGAIFSDTTESELQVTSGNLSAHRIGVISQIPASAELHPDCEFLIGTERWKYRGPGGNDTQSGTQSALVRLPKPSRHAVTQ